MQKQGEYVLNNNNADNLIYRSEIKFLDHAYNKQIVLYDTGNSDEVVSYLCENGLSISHIVCDDFWRWNKTEHSYMVRSPHSLKNGEYVVLITSPYYAYAVEKELSGLDVTDVFCYGFFDRNLNRTFKIGYNKRFVPGKAFPRAGNDNAYIAPSITNNCNCRCPFCNVKYIKNNGSPDMPLEKYIALLDNIKGLWVHGRLIDTIELDGSRELFVYPQYKEAIVETAKRGFNIQLVTNGVLLTHENSKLLLENNLFVIIISIGGITANVYAKHQGFNETSDVIGYAEKQLKTVKKNVEKLVKLRTDLGSQAKIGISYILDELTQPQLKDASVFWQSLGVDFLWGNAMVKTDEWGELLEKRSHSNETVPSEICFHLGVASNGDLNPCYFGEGAIENIIIGNVFEKPLSEIIKTAEFNSFYEGLSSRDRNNMHPVCVRCPSSGCC